MSQAKSLRAIGQSLDILRVEAFEINKAGSDFVVRADQLSRISSQALLEQHLVRNEFTLPTDKRSNRPVYTESMRYSPMSISWLEAYGRRKRKKGSVTNRQGGSKLSHLLRALGEHLDRLELSAAKIAWSPDRVLVELERGGYSEHKQFSLDQLQELGLRMKRRRSSRLVGVNGGRSLISH